MRPGQTARIVGLSGHSNPGLASRILEIGLVPGTVVRYLRAAPLGDPIEVDVEGFLLSLRRNEAEVVLVEID
ncbi:MAG: FeoA family protein [Candidatus Zixiibacteriota bacterium]